MRTLPLAVLLVTGIANADPAARPALTFETPIKIEPVGELDAAIVQRTLASHRARLLECYERDLRATRGLQGTVTARFTIDGRAS